MLLPRFQEPLTCKFPFAKKWWNGLVQRNAHYFLGNELRQDLQPSRWKSKEYSEALTLRSGLIKDVRRSDDKPLLVDIDHLESKLRFSLRNLPKAKASSIAARTAANAMYVPPAQQGTIRFTEWVPSCRREELQDILRLLL